MGAKLLPALGARLLPAGTAACGAAEEQLGQKREGHAGIEEREGDFIRFHDGEVGVSGRYFAGWHRLRALTDVVVPRYVLALGTYPLQGGGKGGGPCAARRDLEAMPPEGALIALRVPAVAGRGVGRLSAHQVPSPARALLGFPRRSRSHGLVRLNRAGLQGHLPGCGPAVSALAPVW